MLLDVQSVLQNFLTNWPFLKIYPPQSGYRKLRRRNSLRQISFSGLYDASLARNNEISVFDLDLGRKTTSPLTVNHAQLQAAMHENHANQCMISKSCKAFNSMHALALHRLEYLQGLLWLPALLAGADQSVVPLCAKLT